MTDKATLLALAERVEGLDRPDRELGREVLRACGWTQSDHGHFLGPLTGWTSPDRAIYFDDDDFVRGRHDPTASLDAAMTLVPEGMRWCVDTCDVMTRAFVEPSRPYDGQTFWGNAVAPELALCAAALRARAETEQ